MLRLIPNPYPLSPNPGFTLTELMIAIGISLVLIASVGVGAIRIYERAQAQELADVLQQTASGIKAYRNDTHEYPRTLARINATNDAENPLLTDPITPAGWQGPYIERGYQVHRWGGAIRWVNEADVGDTDTDNSQDDIFIVLDDDAPTGAANTGLIPPRVLEALDTIIDDGNLTTGDFRGNGCSPAVEVFNTACGEGKLRIRTAAI